MLKSKVRKLAKQRKGFIGSMAVSAFEVLREQGVDECGRDLRFSNILAYLGGSLMLDVEGNTDFSLADCGDRPPLAVDDSQIDGRIIQKIILATRSYYTGRRTAATLTFLKLCRYPGVRRHLLNQQALDNFIRQLQRKETSLLAAYALMTCLKYGLWGSSDLSVDGTLTRVVGPIVTMLRKGWFDDAVGLVEGFEIFRHLMKHDKLKRAINNEIYDALKKKLVHERDGIRTSLLCIDILEDSSAVSASLAESDDSNLSTYATSHSSEPPSIVTRLLRDSLECLKNQPWVDQRKCIKILSALSQTAAGEEAIRSHIDEVLGMLLPEYHWTDDNPTVPKDNIVPNPRPVPPSRMLGPSYALYLLSRNESLRGRIRQSKRYSTLKGRYLSGSLVNGPDTPPWQVKTPNKSDVLVMIARMIRVVDEGFSYDGIGSIPEPLPVVIRHISNLGVLLRDGAVRALQVLPGLAIGFVYGTTTVISRGADRFRRGTAIYTHHTQDPHSRTLELDMVVPSRQNGGTPVSPTQRYVPAAPNVLWDSISQPPHLNYEQEFVDLPRYHSQESVFPDQVTRFTTPSPPLIRRESYDARPRLPGNGHDQIIEVPRETRSVVMPARPDPAEIGPSLYRGRQVHAVHTSDSPFIPSERFARRHTSHAHHTYLPHSP
ncbi:hypothetical protein HD554DRAFT_1192385 [Boletus coccyginus]|nr:hypothetical protein HD554DRAFT_1192385 [Boletus coccyginus]